MESSDGRMIREVAWRERAARAEAEVVRLHAALNCYIDDQPSVTVCIIYVNRRGETVEHHIKPAFLWYGSSSQGDPPCFHIEALDIAANTVRTFALERIQCWAEEAVAGKKKEPC